MILCVTLNPCLDKTLTVPPWRPGDLVRGVAIREVVGGKGNNVARALRRLGRDPVPVTFLGGPTGASCESLLRTDDGLEPMAIPTAAPTRVILTVRTEASADQTAFFDPDPAITPAEADAMLQRIEEALRGDVAAMTLSGSSPSPATHGLFSDLIALARRGRSRSSWIPTGRRSTASGASGRRPSSSIAARPPPISASRASPTPTRPPCSRTGHRHGVVCGIITDGPDPVAIQFRGQRYRAIPPAIQAVNPIGSGDSLLAGLVDGWLERLDPEPLIRHALACAVANALVWDAGAIDPAEVERWSEQIEVESLSK